MASNFAIGAVFLLASVTCIGGQYFDFIQALQPYIQTPSQPLNFFNDFTTRRSKPKQKDNFNATRNENTNHRPSEAIDKIKRKQATKPPFEDTQKPARRTKTPLISDGLHRAQQETAFNTRLTVPKATGDSRNRDISAIIYFEDDIRRTTKVSDTKSISRERPESQNGNKNENIYQSTSNYVTNWNDGVNSVNYYTTRPTTKAYTQNNRINSYTTANNRRHTTKSYTVSKSQGGDYYYTTHNPLLNRPGVKPPVVDGPPITNKPATQRPDGHKVTQADGIPEVTAGPNEDFMTAVEKKRLIDIAERMCDKYKSLNVKQVHAIPLVPSPDPVRVNISSCAPTNVPLVVGGRVVNIQEFPHMALLGWKKTKDRGYSWKCGGSLLSNQFILTAAHCGYQDRDDNVISGPPRMVQLGSSFLNDPKAVLVGISTVIRHPKFKPPKAYYDLAIVKMVKTVAFSETIKPACLGIPPRAKEPIIATGWGRTEFGGSQSHELRSVSIPVWDMTDCHRALGVSMKIPNGPSSDSQICAGERDGGKDTCQGDSGGPAQIQDGCTWRVVAVTSVGRACGEAETPAIYATVQRPFISAVVFDNQLANNQNRATVNNENRTQKNKDQTNSRNNAWNNEPSVVNQQTNNQEANDHRNNNRNSNNNNRETQHNIDSNNAWNTHNEGSFNNQQSNFNHEANNHRNNNRNSNKSSRETQREPQQNAWNTHNDGSFNNQQSNFNQEGNNHRNNNRNSNKSSSETQREPQQNTDRHNAWNTHNEGSFNNQQSSFNKESNKLASNKSHRDTQIAMNRHNGGNTHNEETFHRQQSNSNQNTQWNRQTDVNADETHFINIDSAGDWNNARVESNDRNNNYNQAKREDNNNNYNTRTTERSERDSPRQGSYSSRESHDYYNNNNYGSINRQTYAETGNVWWT